MTNAATIGTARVYDDSDSAAGARLLVDRVWPRGTRKQDLHLDAWLKDVAPSTGLRKWFGHDPEKWGEFRARYHAELDENPDAVARCLDWCRKGPTVLLYSAKDKDHNQAIVLRDYLRAALTQGMPG